MLFTSFIPPVLQSTVGPVASQKIVPRQLQMYHAQLDPRMATAETAGAVPVGARSMMHRSAILALYGEESGHQYVPLNVTGAAKTSRLDFVDLECDIVATLGRLSNDEWYYNFSSTRVVDGWRHIDYTFLGFNATLFNGTHFLYHNCIARPAIGWCSVNLIQGIGIMESFSCYRERWVERPSEDPHGPAAGFVAIAAAFHDVFEGEAWVTRVTHRPQQNSSFVLATAKWEDRGYYTMPPSLIDHFQRVLWHVPINARPKEIPDGQEGGRFDLDGVVELNVLDEQQIMLQRFNFARNFAGIAACLFVGVGAIIWVILGPKSTTGSLIQDSLVQTLTVSGRVEPAISDASTAGLGDILDNKGRETLRYRGGDITVD
ncbi:hypothetical protein DL765_005587 [Monosporascus sp. GIB2]|nr:hypothetical protein DL765_005587 [Monosporascus sp. GIB2]